MRKRSLSEQAKNAPPPDVKVGLEIKSENSDEKREILSVAHDVRTVDDALKKAEIDLDLWEIERCVINSWECVGDKIGRQPLWQVKVWLKRKSPKKYTDAIESLCERIKTHAPRYPKLPKRKCKEPHLLEVCIFDAHFGKLAWEPETGHNYDLRITERIFQNAVHDLCNRAVSSYENIDRVLFPIGNDFLHVDGLESATTKGTRVDSDGRYPKIIECAAVALQKAIDFMAGIAPVDILWIPGNHDRIASYHICRELKAHYHHAKHVAIDVTPPTRKYYKYGKVLLGFCHGDKEPLGKLPHVMATERPQDWAETTHHEWHSGDKHHKKQRDWLSVDEHNGTVVRILSSISGTDAWHYDNLYVNSRRAAECFLWHKERGYSGHFSADVRESLSI